MTRICFCLSGLLATLVTLAGSASAQQQPGPKDEPDRPHDLILAVDVSRSMLGTYRNGTLPANDPEGIRWDGIQFLIDVARDHDRIALVLFRAENEVLTRFIDAKTGFVTLGRRYDWDGQPRTGRELLKELVAEVQRREAKLVARIREREARKEVITDADYRDYTLDLFARHPRGKKITLAHGTASLLALERIRKTLLPEAGKDGARAWTMLFTDGEEEACAEGWGTQYATKDYAYIDQRKPLRGEQLEAWVGERWGKPFRDRGVPIIAFGLGKSCDRPLLRSLARTSTAAERQRYGASYEPETNLDLLKDLQHLLWELREAWRLEVPRRVPAPGREIFSVPGVGLWDDLGVLVYREPVGPRPRALAPDPAHMKPPWIGTAELAALKPRVGRSHWYYALSRETLTGLGAPRGSLELSVVRPAAQHDDYVTRCIAAMRAGVAFRYTGPGPDERPLYTPRDLIPFEVEFTPPPLPAGASPFQAEDFKVEVTVTPVGGRPETFELELQPAGAGPTRTFRNTGKVLDGTAASSGASPFVGSCHVDVTVTGVRGPLAGARRRLIRRTLEIGPYPTLRLPAALELTNAAGSGEAALDLTLAQRTAPDGLLTETDVALKELPFSSKAAVPRAALRLPTGKLALRGKGEVLRVGLTPEAWARLPVGVYKYGVIEVRLPWEQKPTRVGLMVRKDPYPLAAQPNVFRLDMAARSRGKPATKEGAGPSRRIEVEVELKTPLATAEPIWLSAARTEIWQADAAEWKARKEPDRVDFTQVEDASGRRLKEDAGTPATIPFRVAGLGPDHAKPALGAGGRQKALLALTLAPLAALPGGGFERVFYLVGPGAVPTPVTIRVVVNAVSLHDRTGEPLDQLFLLGLAGSQVRHTLTFTANRPGAQVKQVRVKPGYEPLRNVSLRGWDRLPLAAHLVVGRRDQAMVDLGSVPWCVQPGKYRTEVTFLVDYADGGEDRSLEVALPVYTEVLHKGVRFQHGDHELHGPLRLRFPADKCAAFAEAPFQLLTDAREIPVRWRARRVAAKGGAGKLLGANEGELDLLFGGASVLTRGGPSDPLNRDNLVSLTVRLARRGLAPGVYRAALEFHSFEHDPKLPLDKAEPAGVADTLAIEAVVPGRQLDAVRAGPSPYLGEKGKVHATLTCHDCDPGPGELRALDGAGNPTGPPLPVGQAERVESDPAVPGVRYYHYAIEVEPAKVGKNGYQLSWPGLCPGDPAQARAVTVEAFGVIEVKHDVVSVGEEVLIHARIDPAKAPEGGSLVLHVLDTADRAAGPVEVTLHDDGKTESGDERAGDGVCTVRHRFAGAGVYEIVYPEAGGPGPLRPRTVRADYELQPPDRLGILEYGSGDRLRWLGIREDLSDPSAARLTNRRSERLRWKARLRFPKGGAEASQVTERNIDTLPAALQPDPRHHLDARLIAEGAGNEAGKEWSAGGVLVRDQTQELGFEVKLPQPALDEVYGDSAAGASHPTLGKTSAVLLEVELEWLDNNEQVVARRTMRMPVAVATRHWAMNPKPWILGGLGVVGLVVAARLLLRMRRRSPKLEPATAAAPEMLPAGPQAAPRPEPPAPAPRKYTLPSSGGDDLPEHMR
ncbi:MAG: hypothetical protein IT429_24160 [Gemmataceae bacterium]|nr:hypothetical protein [Gemmataceae bacterium]